MLFKGNDFNQTDLVSATDSRGWRREEMTQTNPLYTGAFRRYIVGGIIWNYGRCHTMTLDDRQPALTEAEWDLVVEPLEPASAAWGGWS